MLYKLDSFLILCSLRVSLSQSEIIEIQNSKLSFSTIRKIFSYTNDNLSKNEKLEILNSNLSNNTKNNIFINIGIFIDSMTEDIILKGMFNEVFDIYNKEDLLKYKDLFISYHYYPHYNEIFNIYCISIIELRKYFKLIINREPIEKVWDYFENNYIEVY